MLRQLFVFVYLAVVILFRILFGTFTEKEVPTDACVYHLNDEYKPEVDEVSLFDEEKKGLMQKAFVDDYYRVDYFSSGVVGLVGAPVYVYYDSQVESPLLEFHYVSEELRGIPERNLIILHLDDERQLYEQVGEEDLDVDRNTISVHIPEPGVYLLADRYEWYSIWGVDVSEYAYTVDPSAYPSDWERECDTGSILELADREWAMEQAPVFHVSTPQQLAGVVYYVNAISTDMETVELYLEADIDLEGYDWVPMGWLGPSGSHFNGLIDGQGHCIENMDIHIPYDRHCAFVGYSTGLIVQNIRFSKAKIRGGAYAGVVGGEIYISREWENVHVDGEISNAYDEVGSIVGREAGLHFKDCSAEVLYRDSSGEATLLEFFSHRQEVIANTPVTEDFTLTIDEFGRITRTEKDGFHNLCWHVDVDGCLMLQRGAEGELSFDPLSIVKVSQGSQCSVWLEAFTGETYTRVSNVIEVPVP